MSIDDEMRRCGWYAGRSVDCTDQVAALQADGILPWPELINFLEEFSGLTFAVTGHPVTVAVDAKRATEGIDPEWGREYGKVLGIPLAPVAQSGDMTIYLAQTGRFVGGVDDLFGVLGSTFATALERALSTDPTTPGLDRELPR